MESYKPLSYLYSKGIVNTSRSECIRNYKKALNYNPEDYECLIEYASMQYDAEPSEALRCYEKALNFILNNKDINHQIQPEIYNNIGVL